MIELKTGPWNLTDLKDIQKNGMKVFSCFSCGGGSTMGYKLSGFDVIGCCEIDPKMMEVYKINHHPKYYYLMGIKEFKNIPNDKLPKEFFELDILDGSPPCSSFSMAGSREKKWGKKSKFKEGQVDQVLDDLFFDFIDVAKKLKPKVIVAENVKGLIQGRAKGYVKQIFQRLKKAGYSVQLFLLNAATMGVPQRRERIFFIANRIDATKLRLTFNEKSVFIKTRGNGKLLSINKKSQWKKIKPGQGLGVINKFNCQKKIHKNKPTFTLSATTIHWHHSEPRELSILEMKELQSFPDDFRFLDSLPNYIMGMSVPPFMIQRIADQIYKQWLNPIKIW